MLTGIDSHQTNLLSLTDMSIHTRYKSGSGLYGALKSVCAAVAITLIASVSLTPVLSHAQEVDSRIEKIVRVDGQDSFNSIAIQEFGSVGMARLLAEYNNLSPDVRLVAGTEIIIPTHLEPKRNFATVAFAKGEATLRVAGSRTTTQKLSSDDRVYSTDVIVTEESGFVSLVLSNGSILNIQPSTTLSLKTLQCLPENSSCEVELDSSTGSVAADVKKRPEQQNRFLISTPYASAAVRGTVFDFGASADELLVGVTHGEVDISADSSVASLPEGFGSRAELGGSPGALVALLKAPSLYQAPERFSSEDIIAWAPVNGAANYQVSLAADESGQYEIYRQSVSGLTHEVNALPAGEVYAIVRPLDEQNFKGFRGKRALNIVNLDTALPKPSLSFEKEDASNSIYVYPQDSTANLLHEVQFSATRDFAQLVSVDIPENGGAKHGIDADAVFYARARVITDDTAVGSYGEILEITALD